MTDNPHLDPLPPDIAAKAAQVKAARTPTRLVFGTDLRPGMVIVKDRKCHLTHRQRLTMLVLAGYDHQHEHGTAEFSVLEVRADRDRISAILVDEAGEQVPFHGHDLDLIRVRIDR